MNVDSVVTTELTDKLYNYMLNAWAINEQDGIKYCSIGRLKYDPYYSNYAMKIRVPIDWVGDILYELERPLSKKMFGATKRIMSYQDPGYGYNDLETKEEINRLYFVDNAEQEWILQERISKYQQEKAERERKLEEERQKKAEEKAKKAAEAKKRQEEKKAQKQVAQNKAQYAEKTGARLLIDTLYWEDMRNVSAIYMMTCGKEIIYIGQTKSLGRRMLEHSDVNAFWTTFNILNDKRPHGVKVLGLYKYIEEHRNEIYVNYKEVAIEDLNTCEEAAIKQYQPKFNFAGIDMEYRPVDR